MASTLAQRLAQLAIPLIATTLLSSCATDEFGELGKPLPPRGEVKRLPPYDPFGTGQPEDADDEDDDAPVRQGLGARPEQAGSAVTEGQNTVSKSQLAELSPPDATPGSPAQPLDASSNLGPFAGLSADELKAQWGAPSLTRNEAGAQLMQFKGKGCVVLAYLYPSTGGGMETAFAEAHPGGDSASAIAGCLGKKARPADVRARKPGLIVKPD